MNKYLMLINIGPVQDFIATARRSRDLWFGSWLLSELSKTAARVIVKINKENYDTLIFPSADEKDLIENSTFNSANKILAIIEENPNQVGKKIKNEIDTRLKRIYNDAFKGKINLFNYELAKKQIDDLIEFYWVAVEFENESQYKEAHKKVEYLAAARKNTRQFAQTSFSSDEEKHLPKSSLDGKRESVIPEYLYPKSYHKDKESKAKKLYEMFKVRDNERLCGVGLLKRLGSESEKNQVASTPHIAALSFLKGLENKTNLAQVAERVKDYVDALAKPKVIGNFNEFYAKFGKLSGSEHKVFKNFDAKILFESRLKEHFENETDLKEAKEALKTFFTETNTKQTELSPYYAVLLADGDNMGKAIDAQMEKDERIKEHRKISTALSEFAMEVKEIVSKHEGSLVYAGGDDVLALIPLHTVLACAEELNKIFREKLKDFTYERDKTPTLSVGIAVAHFLEPLSDALELARKAEKEAKAVEGKNALAIIVDKRSGTSRTIKGQFAKDENSSGIIEHLRTLMKLDSDGEVSRQAAYELRDLSRRLEVFGDKTETQKFAEIKAAEAKRILKRKIKTGENVDLKDNRFYKILETENGAEKLADELITAKFFADAEKMAGNKNQEDENNG